MRRLPVEERRSELIDAAVRVIARGGLARVKGGRTKESRGLYTRAKPFFAMAFDSPRSALGILLEIDDMIAATTAGKITMQGAPEYGAELGELMLLVGGYAK